MKFTEDTRVKIPAILHLVRLGYQYLSLKDQNWDLDTNIFPGLFRQAISKINPGIDYADIGRLLEDVKLTLDNDDLGHAFYNKLADRSGTKLIDFENFNNNSFHVITELTYQNGD
ncbi:MAG: type I restriction endonuclease [Methylobacter sp.]|nr:type I restriction endonuclease [Methylobacter sp.]